MARTSAQVEGAGSAHAGGDAPAAEAAGEDHDDVLAEAGDLLFELGAGAGANADHGDDGADADDDAQHGEEGAHFVAQEGHEGDADGGEDSPHTSSAEACSTSRWASCWVGSRRFGDRRVGLDAAVAHDDIAFGVAGDVEFVRDHDEGDALVVEPAEGIHDLDAGAGVEVAGRFVGQDEGRLHDEGTGDGDPLLLAAGELVGEVIGAVAEPDQFEGAFHPGALFFAADQLGVGVKHGSSTFSRAEVRARRLKP
jgi:hypothetical protein